ncbi:hypothetical protein SBA3_880043 [Candidatus Sulfopaludibacter sp. SbA3]|nr:hypothetical protein SBA3_880043 [Candidatus Sulfopaludibacter sp. SbA3]
MALSGAARHPEMLSLSGDLEGVYDPAWSTNGRFRICRASNTRRPQSLSCIGFLVPTAGLSKSAAEQGAIQQRFEDAVGRPATARGGQRRGGLLQRRREYRARG